MTPNFQAMALKETQKELQELTEGYQAAGKPEHPVTQTAALFGTAVGSLKALVAAGYIRPGSQMQKIIDLNTKLIEELVTVYVRQRTAEMYQNYQQGNSSDE